MHNKLPQTLCLKQVLLFSQTVGQKFKPGQWGQLASVLQGLELQLGRSEGLMWLKQLGLGWLRWEDPPEDSALL